MALSNELGLSGFHPKSTETTATATLEDLTAGWTLPHVPLDVRVKETVNHTILDEASRQPNLMLADKSPAVSKRLILRLPLDRINWITSSFLIGTLLLTLTAVPLYLYHFGLDWFQVALFFVMLWACGFSVTIGYHRLFSHLSFQAHWSVKLFTLIFGAGAFENSALMWSSEHRTHHKHVDPL